MLIKIRMQLTLSTYGKLFLFYVNRIIEAKVHHFDAFILQ